MNGQFLSVLYAVCNGPATRWFSTARSLLTIIPAFMVALTSQNAAARQTPKHTVTTRARVESKLADSIVLACPPGYVIAETLSFDGTESIYIRNSNITVRYMCERGKGSKDTVHRSPFIGEDADIKFVAMRDYCAFSKEQMSLWPPGPSVCEKPGDVELDDKRNIARFKVKYRTQDGIDCMKGTIEGDHRFIPYWTLDNHNSWFGNYGVGIDDKCRYVAVTFANKLIVTRLTEKKLYIYVQGLSFVLEKSYGR